MKNTILTIIAMLFSTFAVAQNGLSVGDKAPNFAAKDQNGTTIILKDALKKGKVVVLFYRGF